jgi:hypothetical protein
VVQLQGSVSSPHTAHTLPRFRHANGTSLSGLESSQRFPAFGGNLPMPEWTFRGYHAA